MKQIVAVVILLGFLSCNDKGGPTTFDGPLPHSVHLAIGVDTPTRMFIKHLPILVPLGSEDFVLAESIRISIRRKILQEVWVFHGLDRGDIGEMDTTILLDGQPIFFRSEHKEDISAFDSWKNKVILPTDRKLGGTVRISISYRSSATNIFLNRDAGRPHWGIWLVFQGERNFLPFMVN